MSAQGRLLTECQLLVKQTAPSVFAKPDEDDVMHWTALIVGPTHTPYARGLFHFDLRFPNDYPNSPPRVQITTTSNGSVRFNPNLYNNGTVCLSILGTWRAESPGEQWSAVQNVLSVLLSIQSLMHDKPYHNEPSFERDDGSGDVQRYNDKIAHETMRVAVLEVMENTLDARTVPNGAIPAFAHLRKLLFAMNFRIYAEAVDGAISKGNSDIASGKQFKMMPFEGASNCMEGTFAWEHLRDRLQDLQLRLAAEVEGWRHAGAAQSVLLRSSSAIGLLPAVVLLREQLEQLQLDPVESVSIGSSLDNPFVWDLSILGPEDTLWEGGCFQVEVVFPPSYPDLSPSIRFTSTMFHPNISADGVPYMATMLLWHGVQPRHRGMKHLLTELRERLVQEPDPEPASHLNLEAARLRFSTDAALRKEYNRKVRRCAQRSNEE